MFGGFEMMHWLVLPIINAFLVVSISIGSFHIGKLHALREIDRAVAEAKEAQRDKEAELQAGMDKLREDKRRETAKLQRTVAALTDSLRDRPERPASMPEVAADGDAGRGCTGAELYRPDSEFLVGEFARAENIRLSLIQCQKAYKNALMQCPATQEDASH